MNDNKYDNFDDSWITIQGWMRSKLNLKGNKLLAFALVYGFCKDGHSEFKGGLKFVSKWLGVSKPTAIATLDSLVNDYKLLTKKDGGYNKPNPYNVNWEEANRLKNLTGKETLLVKKLYPQGLKNLTSRGKETLPYSNIDNTIDSNTYTKEENQQSVVSGKDALTAGDTAANYLIQFLKDNPGYLQEMHIGDWQRAVKGHCNKLQKNGEIYELTIPKDEGKLFMWLSKRLAGIKSWYSAASQFDNKNQRKPQQQRNKQPKEKYSPTGGATISHKEHLRTKMLRAKQAHGLAKFNRKPEDEINRLYHLYQDAERAYQNAE